MKKVLDERRINKKIVITFTCILVVALCVFLHSSRFELFLTSKTNGIEIKDEQYIFEKNQEDGSFWYRIVINYPQVLSGAESHNIEKANTCLRNAAFSILEKTYEESITHLKDRTKFKSSAEVKYNILYVSDSYVSILFDILAVTGGPSYTAHHLTTVNINDGRYLLFNDLANGDKLFSLVEADAFEIIEGTYSELHEDYFHEPEVKQRIVEILKSELEKDVLSDGFDRFSSQNIGRDEGNLYLYLPFDEAFHRYIILRVPWEWE